MVGVQCGVAGRSGGGAAGCMVGGGGGGVDGMTLVLRDNTGPSVAIMSSKLAQEAGGNAPTGQLVDQPCRNSGQAVFTPAG